MSSNSEGSEVLALKEGDNVPQEFISTPNLSEKQTYLPVFLEIYIIIHLSNLQNVADFA